MPLLKNVQTLQDIILKEYFELIGENLGTTSGEYGIFIIKPDGLSLSIAGCSFRQLLLQIMGAVGFSVIKTYKTSFNLDELKILFPPFGSDLFLWDGWKDDFKNHMLNKEMEVILFSGKDAIGRSCVLKEIIRRNLLNDDGDDYHRVIANLLHSVDMEDFDVSYKLLFKN